MIEMFHQPQPITISVVLAFFVLYTYFLFIKTRKNSLDLYDFLLLWTPALGPTLTVLFPKQATQLANAVGVKFPFVILFGGLIVVAFVFLIYLISRVHKAKKTEIRLVQEIALLSEQLKQLGEKHGISPKN